MTELRQWFCVSKEMEAFRDLHRTLNRFLWTTQLSYGLTINVVPRIVPDTTQPVSEAMAHIVTEAWTPNNQGRTKLPGSVGDYLQQTEQNSFHLFRAIITHFASAFEGFLDARVGTALGKGRPRNWGPYLTTLDIPALRETSFPVTLERVIAADMSRLVRNSIVHAPFEVPQNLQDANAKVWGEKLVRSTTDSKWAQSREMVIEKFVANALNEFVGGAHRGVRKARGEGKNLSIEFFYMLYSFHNLDRLACEIEQALIPPKSRPAGRINSPFLRRIDLVADAPGSTDEQRA